MALLNDILDLSKIEAGKMMMEKVPFDLRGLIEDCAKAHQPKAAQKNIHLFTDIAPGVPRQVLGDPLRMRQIVANLLSNAMKFTERGSVRVRLEAKALAGRAVEVGIHVTDTGTGIPPDKLTHIFDKFTQADGSISRKYGGTGLGLAITKRLVEMYEGAIRVESELGRGSTFHVTLRCELPAKEPGVEGNGSSRRMSDASAAAPQGTPARILVVEDNLVNQKVVTAILRKRRYYVEVANDGREAISALERAPADAPFHLVLMDVQMPVLDGLEATRAIRRNENWNSIPIVAMTAHAMTGDRERCLLAGMNGYISKPVNPAHLLATLEEHLSAVKTLPALPSGPAKTESPDPSLSARLMTADSDLLESMLQLFLQLAPERLQKLDSAIERGDTRALVAEAQKIVSAARPIAAGSVTASARFIEAAARRDDFEAARAGVRNLSEAIRSLTQNAPAASQ